MCVPGQESKIGDLIFGRTRFEFGSVSAPGYLRCEIGIDSKI